MATSRESITREEYERRVKRARRQRAAGPCIVREMTEEEKADFADDFVKVARSRSYLRGGW